MAVTESAEKKVNLMLEKLGKIAVAKFLKALAVAKTKHFKADYRVNSSLSLKERDALQNAEAEQQRQESNVKAGFAVPSEFSKPFDLLVLQYVTVPIELATKAFKNQLDGSDMKSDILVSQPKAEQKVLELEERRDSQDV